MSDVVLQTMGLTKRYGDLVAVDDLTLDVYQGEVLGFLGPNGAGKTTSINMMCGLLKPDAGHVLIHGARVDEDDADVRARVGVCPQDIVLWERLTCLEQLRFIGRMYDVPARQVRRRAEQLLDELGLSDKRDQQARTLSGGMQRRLNLAMALVHDPEIIVLDEPEAGLDPQSRVKVRQYIQSLARRKTVILTTHNMDEADRVADRVAIIDHGRLLVLDTPQALKRQVGEGDVVEIDLNAPLDDDGPLQQALAGLASQTWLSGDRRTLSVRALNAVGKLPAILDALEATGPSASPRGELVEPSGQAMQPGEIRVRENTLEDVFIQLTGKGLRE